MMYQVPEYICMRCNIYLVLYSAAELVITSFHKRSHMVLFYLPSDDVNAPGACSDHNIHVKRRVQNLMISDLYACRIKTNVDPLASISSGVVTPPPPLSKIF